MGSEGESNTVVATADPSTALKDSTVDQKELQRSMSKSIPPCLNLELNDGDHEQKQSNGRKSIDQVSISTSVDASSTSASSPNSSSVSFPDDHLQEADDLENDSDSEFFDTKYHHDVEDHHVDETLHKTFSSLVDEDSSSASESAGTHLKTNDSSISLSRDYESDELENMNPSNNPRIRNKMEASSHENFPEVSKFDQVGLSSYSTRMGGTHSRGSRNHLPGILKRKPRRNSSAHSDSYGRFQNYELEADTYYSLRNKEIRSQTDLTDLVAKESHRMPPSASSSRLSSSRYFGRRKNLSPADRALHVRKGAYTKVVTPRPISDNTDVYPKMKGEVEPEETEEEFYARIFNEWEEQDRLSNHPGSWYSTLLWFPILLVLRQINLFLSLTFWPTKQIARLVFGVHLDTGGGFWNVPLEKKKQATMVFMFLMMLPGIAVAGLTFFILLIFPLTTIPAFLYLLFIFRWDRSPWTGSRHPFMRYWKMWRHFANYFPCRLIKTHNLDPNEKYVFCYHPHGIISLGAFGNFATDATGFSRKFPGIDLKLMTLEINFFVPFLREILLWMGIVNCSKRACNTILQSGRGKSIMLVVGGAAESLQSAPGTYRLNVDSRKGFVRVALDNGANLVPVLAFGENDAFSTHYFDEGSTGRWLQEEFKKRFGFATPIFYGRGFANKQFGLMPHRTPIIAVVGKPIKVPKLPPHLRGDKLRTTAEGRALVVEYHEKYIAALKALYDKYKNRWAINRCESLLLVGKNPQQMKSS
mmetsp:Transcript_16048/g.18156  ORF Transcript_16048/g.18156 Transcript_16048/m.18156 type:complete len:757 (+) Transcript_16048:289-2559(+)